MSPDYWHHDLLDLELLSPHNPLARGFDGLAEVLELIESLDEDLRPDRMRLKRELKYSRKTLRERLHETLVQGRINLMLSRSRPVEVLLEIVDPLVKNEDVQFILQLRLRPFPFQASVNERYSRELLRLARAFAARYPVSYGYSHSSTDASLGSDPHVRGYFAPKQVYEAHWLSLYGSRMVEQLGRSHVLATPACLVEELPYGTVLLLTRPTPADFASEEARVAQARALVHLRPELEYEGVLTTLRQRSQVFAPLDKRFHPDIADLLELTLKSAGLVNLRQETERLNDLQPPPVSECLPAHAAPGPDVPDVQAAIRLYEGLCAEQLAALLHKRVPSVMKASPESLPEIDHHLWLQNDARHLTPDTKEQLIAALGAYLGMLLVSHLGGRWVPRQKLDEAAVVVGDTAWLPFLRARHHLQSKHSALTHSLTQLYREARRR